MPQSKNCEIITINCGGAGITLGQTIVEQFAAEQGIASNGEEEYKTEYTSSIPISFQETSDGKFISRSLFCDLDPYSVNTLKRRYSHKNLLSPINLICRESDAADNFAIGYHSKGKEIIDTINESIRNMMESCNNCQGFVLNHSMNGGTGSGLGSLILDQLYENYQKKCRFTCSIYDSQRCSNMSKYNSVLAMDHMIEKADISLLFDNHKIHDIHRNTLQLKAPLHSNYNELITKVMSDLTATSRFAINDTLHSIQMDMCPFQRLHFLISGIYPLIPKTKKGCNLKDNIQTLLCQSLEPSHWMVSDMYQNESFDSQSEPYMAIAFGLRGNKVNKCQFDACQAIQFMRTNKKYEFADWTASVPMLKFIEDSKPVQLLNDDILMTDIRASMLMNNVWLGRLFGEVFTKWDKGYDTLHDNKAYIHHYVKLNGMEEIEFAEARENLGFLEKDYMDIVTEQSS